MSDKISKALRASIKWFQNSGVMDPADGSWGVAERVAIVKGNEAAEKMFSAFPSYTVHGDYAVIEQRRPDCNFETALMFLLASKVFDDEKLRKTGENILTYLYCRSRMRNIGGREAGHTPEAWKWAHCDWKNTIYFDDNAWNCVIQLMIAKIFPELGKKFDMRRLGLALAEGMNDAFEKQFEVEEPKMEHPWAGDLKSPHWGSLVVMALAFAHAETKNAKYAKSIVRYCDYALKNMDSFTSSEHAYVAIGSSAAMATSNDESVEKSAAISADKLLSKMDMKTGNIPSEWGKEAPTGEHLVDTIYTINWALLGLRNMGAVSQDKKYADASDKIVDLLVKIQDKTPDSFLKGCWRGMYDLKAKKWGGGDRYEGGANSIYSGWTNAPIAFTLASKILGMQLLNPGK